MHPAFSVIFFTTISGAGYGVLVFLGLLSLANTEILSDNNIAQIFAIICFIGMGLVAIGLVSSSFHLANKKNAWRAFFRFKSSWLAREAVFAVLSFPITLLFIASFYFLNHAIVIQALATLTIIVSIVTIYSTGMIYSCLKTIRAWNTPLVPFNYIILGLLTGNLIVLSIFMFIGVRSPILEITLMTLLIIGFISKIIYYKYVGEPSPLSMKTATGLPGKTVRLLDTGESAANANFLTKEFGYQVGPKTINTLRVISVVFMFVVPMFIVINPSISVILVMLITIINYIGSMAERWLFFAEAKHVVNLFYGRDI